MVTIFRDVYRKLWNYYNQHFFYLFFTKTENKLVARKRSLFIETNIVHRSHILMFKC